jgi:hypothetical protein
MLEFDQNILSKYPLKKASLDFKTTRRQRKDMFRSRMRCDPKTKCKMAKIHNKIIDNSAPFLDQLFWQYLCFAKHFLFFYQFKDVLVTIWLMTSSFTNSTRFLLTIIRSRFLKFLQLFN